MCSMRYYSFRGIRGQQDINIILQIHNNNSNNNIVYGHGHGHVLVQ